MYSASISGGLNDASIMMDDTDNNDDGNEKSENAAVPWMDDTTQQ